MSHFESRMLNKFALKQIDALFERFERDVGNKFTRAKLKVERKPIYHHKAGFLTCVRWEISIEDGDKIDELETFTNNFIQSVGDKFKRLCVVTRGSLVPNSVIVMVGLDPIRALAEKADPSLVIKK